MGFHGLEMRHATHDDSGSVSSATELKVSFTTYFAVAFATESG
jgi:hypothetical protein